MPTREELEAELARRARLREVQAELDRRARLREVQAELDRRQQGQPPAPAPAPAPVPAPAPARAAAARPVAAPVPVQTPPARPVADIATLSRRATELRIAGQADKAALIQAQLDALIAKQSRGVTVSAEPEPRRIPVPGTQAEAEDIQQVAEKRAGEIAARRNLPVSETQALIDLERQQEIERRSSTVTPEGVEPGPSPALPFLRPTRMVDVFQPPLAEPVQKYRDPITGELREPTTGERVTEAMARQTIMPESAALAFQMERQNMPAEQKSAIKNLLSQRVPGQGITETALGASMRTIGTLTPAFLNTTIIAPALSFFDVPTTRDQPVGFGADPEGRRRVDESLDYTSQLAQGIQQGRGIGDELSQITPLVKATAKAFGENEEYARNVLWGTGTLSELFTPATPIGVVAPAVKGATKVVKAVTPARAAAARARPLKAVRDRALLGTMARRTYPEVQDIPRFGTEDAVVDIVSRQSGIPADEVRTTLRAQVPDDYVQISASVAAPKSTAAKELADAQREVAALVEAGGQFGARLVTPAKASKVLDDILVARATGPGGRASGLRQLDELSVRSMSPTPVGVTDSAIFDDIVSRTVVALYRDLLPGGVVRPDNALAASIYNQVRDSSLRVTQDLRDEILDIAKDLPPNLRGRPAKNRLLSELFDRRLASSENREKLIDKIIEDGLGRVGDTPARRAAIEAGKKAKERLAAREAREARLGTARLALGDVFQVLSEVSRELGITLPGAGLLSASDSLADRLLPIMAATIIEDVIKPTVVGETGSAIQRLAELQRGRPARAGEITVGGAQVAPRTTTGQAWSSGLDSAFQPADMFDPAALNAAWSDNLGTFIEGAAGLRKRFSLYVGSQFGPIPNVPAWTDRFIRAAAISVAQVGMARTGVAPLEAFRIARAAPEQVLFIGADGVRWTPNLLAKEGQRLGLGLSAQDIARQGAANRVLVQRVQRAVEGRVRSAIRTATIGPDYAGFATGMSDAYRQAIFAGALRSGESTERAAALARRSLIDWTKTDPFITQTVTRYMASAAENWEGLATLVDAMRRNPALPVYTLRMRSALARSEDPYGMQGDASRRALMSLRIGSYDVLLGSNPVVWSLESALGTVAMLDSGVITLQEVIEGSTSAIEAGTDITLAAAGLAGKILLGELEPVQPTISPAAAKGKMTDTEMLGVLLYLSAPSGPYPEWRPLIDSNFPRALVPPPKGQGIAGFESSQAWRNIPSDWRERGLIWEVLPAEDVVQFPEELREVAARSVRVYRPEPEAKALIRGLRGLAPGLMQDGVRGLAADAVTNPARGVGVPASEPSLPRVATEALLVRGAIPPGQTVQAATEALRATRAGE